VPTVTIQKSITKEETAEALAYELGDHYTVAVREDRDAVKVKTSALSTASVRLERTSEATTFHVHGGGIIIGRIINEFGIARRVADAIQSSPRLGRRPE
jgi:hypothetical protein